MVTSLSGSWLVKYNNGYITGVVPGDVTYDFYREGLIDNPYYDENYKQSAWITKADWVYEKRFTVKTKDLLDNTYLLFEGVDTFSNVYLNGKLLGETANMHRGYRFDVNGLLKEGENVLTVNLKNVYNALDGKEQDKYTSIFCANRLFVRKAQCHFGWDWAPKFPGYGIYRDVKLVSERCDAIDDLSVLADHTGNLQLRIDFADKFNGKIEVVIKKDNQTVARREKDLSCKKALLTLKVENPELWWPNGYGEATLYSYTVYQKDENGLVLSEKNGKFGFRTVELDQSIIGEDRLNFAIKVNGKKIFCRGSNWIPAECMTGTLTEEKYRLLVSNAKDANMNMLRVWGGGIYENDCFYSYCDEMGIMVWQEFMFACSEIPDDIPEFSNEITNEAIYQVKRLRNHPSIVIWCGMNEIRGSFNEDEEERYGKTTLHYLLRGVVGQLSPNVPYVRSSPFAFADIENDVCEGDCHNNLSEPCLFGASFKGFEDFNYENRSESEILKYRLKNFERYVIGTENNFSTECAVLGFCNYESLLKFTPKDKIYLDSEFFTERFLGNPYTYVMPTFYERQKVFAEGLFGKLESVKDLAKKANRAQAEVMKTEIVYSRINDKSNGFLNWMFNDIWPTGTWSVIDYYLSKKPAFYAMKRCFSPLLAEICRIGDEYLVCVVTDGNEKVELNVDVKLKDYSGREEAKQVFSGVTEAGKPFAERITLPIIAGRYLEAEIKVGDKQLFAYCDLGRFFEDSFTVDYTTAITELSKDEYAVTVKANTFLPCFKIWAGECAYVEDNYFDLGAGNSKTVRVTTDLNPENFVFNSFFDEWNK